MRGFTDRRRELTARLASGLPKSTVAHVCSPFSPGNDKFTKKPTGRREQGEGKDKEAAAVASTATSSAVTWDMYGTHVSSDAAEGSELGCLASAFGETIELLFGLAIQWQQL